MGPELQAWCRGTKQHDQRFAYKFKYAVSFQFSIFVLNLRIVRGVRYLHEFRVRDVPILICCGLDKHLLEVIFSHVARVCICDAARPALSKLS